MSEKVYFMHVPKCGGTSIHHLIDNNYDQKDVYTKGLGVLSKQEKNIDIDGFKVYHGHTNVIDRIGEEFKTFTILRDPKTRLISQINHWLDFTENEIHSGPKENVAIKFEMQERGVSGFLQSSDPRILKLFKNGMTKMLIDSSTVKGVNGLNDLSDDELLEKAKCTLDRLDFVGVIEELPKSIDCICDLFSWCPPNNLIHSNRRDSSRLKIDKDMESQMESYLNVDIKIYEYAMMKFEKFYGEFESRQKQWASSKYLMNKSLTFKYGDRDHIVSIVDFEKGHKAIGFHEREGIDLRKIYRWAGQCDESKVFFPLPKKRGKGDFVVEVYSISRMQEKMFDVCRFLMNGTYSDSVKFIGSKDGLDVFRVRFKNIPDNYGVGEFTIYSPLLISHNDLDPNCPDKRKKSIAINKIEAKYE
ncbi:sulfotransferase family 2 domain-containing protein [Marinomonas dokdonensis]|uniref:sulfotransferase family 2 domain-containing protein n=1 Tax=Marinomonas dokdonensis TaxID=328224 RepID=UPI0040553AE5